MNINRGYRLNKYKRVCRFCGADFIAKSPKGCYCKICSPNARRHTKFLSKNRHKNDGYNNINLIINKEFKLRRLHFSFCVSCGKMYSLFVYPQQDTYRSNCGDPECVKSVIKGLKKC